MLKKILTTVCTVLAAAYLFLAVTAFNRKPAGRVCEDLELVIRDTVYAGFITQKEVISLLDKSGLNPVGKNPDATDTRAMEQALAQHPLIDGVECYKTPSGKVCVEVSQRIPILRIMSNNGENYYVDNRGKVMLVSAKCIAHVAVATGNISQDFATRQLYPFGLFLQNDAFWNAQTEQIHVLPDNTIELVPRVGDHLIYMGKLKNYRRKLERVRLFYEKALNQVGWNKYSRINVEFDNQIICTRREQ